MGVAAPLEQGSLRSNNCEAMNLSLVHGSGWAALAIERRWAIVYINAAAEATRPQIGRVESVREAWGSKLCFDSDRSVALSDDIPPGGTVVDGRGFTVRRATRSEPVFLKLISFQGRCDVIVCDAAGNPFVDSTLLSLY